MSKASDLIQGGIRQLAFVVPDAAEAARRHSELTGSGPYFLMAHYAMAVHEHHGVASELDVTSAWGQWGDIQVEFIQMHNDNPSAYRDSYPDGGPGMHHTAVFVPDVREAVDAYAREGYPVAMWAEREKGQGYAIMDTRAAVGFMIELYEESLVGNFYKMIRAASVGFDGTDPVRTTSFGSFLGSSS